MTHLFFVKIGRVPTAITIYLKTNTFYYCYVYYFLPLIFPKTTNQNNLLNNSFAPATTQVIIKEYKNSVPQI